MKLSIKTAVLRDALGKIRRFADDRATTNIAMRGVWLVAEGASLQCEAFSRGTGARITAEAVVSDEGDILVPARVLTDIVGKMPGEDVTLETKGNTLHVSGGGPSFEVRAISQVEDFVAMPAVDADAGGTIDAGAFFAGVKAITPAVGKDETRPALTGVNVEQGTDGSTKIIATDSYRLAVYEIAGGAGGVFGLLPGVGGVLANIERIVGDGEVRVVQDERYTTFVGDDGQARIRLVDAAFPNWQQLLPDSTETTVTIDAATLKGVLTRAATMAEGHLPVRVTIGENDLSFSVVSGNVGNFHEKVPAKVAGDDGFEIGLSIAYLTDGVGIVSNASGGDSLQLKFNGAVKPVVLDSHGGSATYLLMPVRI